MSAFVDTSAWYAAVYRRDRNNLRARELLSGGDPLVTSDQVLAETWSLVRQRISWKVAETFWARLRAQPVRLEVTTMADREAAFAIGQTFPDQDFSLTDRTSFAIMERLGISRVIAFDRDFAIYRYGPKRRLAFELLR